MGAHDCRARLRIGKRDCTLGWHAAQRGVSGGEHSARHPARGAGRAGDHRADRATSWPRSSATWPWTGRGCEARAGAGDAGARRALAITGRTSFMLSGAQLGITVTGLVVGYVAEPLIGDGLGELLGGVGVPTGVGVAIGTVARAAVRHRRADGLR